MKIYTIADYPCIIKANQELTGTNYKPFECDHLPDGQTALFEIEATVTSSLPEPEHGVLIEDFPDEILRIKVYKVGDKTRLVSYEPKSDIPFSVMECSPLFDKVHLWISNDAKLDYAFNNAMMILFTCAAGVKGDAVLFHSSVIVKDEKAYMFLGKSGTGKSTHTGLWLKHIMGSHLLNDDNPAVRITENGIRVYGTPWSGKTPCYISADYPVGGIVRLWQAPQNKITRLKGAMAFASILPTVSNLPCSKEVTEGVRSTITKIVEQVPVYRFDCLPNADAAQLSFSTLTQS